MYLQNPIQIKKRKKLKTLKLHLTNGIRYAAYSAARGSAKHQSGFALCGILLHHILRLLETYGFLYRNRKNVVYLKRYMQFG